MPALVVQDIPYRLRRALIRDAKARDWPVNEVVLMALAKRYRLLYEPGRTRFTGGVTKPTATFDLTRPVHEAVQDEARDLARSSGRATTQRGVVLMALSEHYDLPPVEPYRRPRTVKP